MTLGLWPVNTAGFLATDFVQWRTLVHETGHNLGAASLRNESERRGLRINAVSLREFDELRTSSHNGYRCEQLLASRYRHPRSHFRRLAQSASRFQPCADPSWQHAASRARCWICP